MLKNKQEFIITAKYLSQGDIKGKYNYESEEIGYNQPKGVRYPTENPFM